MNVHISGKRAPFVDVGQLRAAPVHLRKRPSPGNYRPDRRLIAIRAEGGRKTSFSAGFVIGGVICGVLGFLYAPQISKALLDEQQRLRVPPFLRDRSPRPVTRDEVIERLDELHSALDQLSQDMEGAKPEEKQAAASNGHAETERAPAETPVVEPNA